MESLEPILDHLMDHPDEMYVLPGGYGVLVFYPPNNSVIYLQGDFAGNEEARNLELQRCLNDLS